MMKKLLSASIFALAALTAGAYEVGDYAYTKVAKYKITGNNLVTNGTFSGDDITAGWTAIDETDSPLVKVFEQAADGGVQVLSGQTALTCGMYQTVKIDAGGTYVVAFKIKGATAGFTDIDLNGAATSYMNAYFNTDGALASVDGTNLLFGENGVNGGYQFSYNADDYTQVVFAVEAPQDGNIIIDFRGMAEGLAIADVECRAAEEVYDDRIANDRIAYFQKYLEGAEFEGTEYDDLQAAVQAVQKAIANAASPTDMATYMENLEDCWSLFAQATFSNVIDLIPTTDGSSNTGNNSANWMNWTTKWNMLITGGKNGQYTGKAPWTWSSDRWCHKGTAVGSPMAIQWMRGAGANGNWNNVATLTAFLQPGTYYWGVTGQGGMMTLNKNRWARSWADECAATQLFFNGDTTEVFILNAARNQDYVFKYELAEADTVTLGIICNNQSSSENAGFDVQFYSPVLYMVLGDGLSPEELAYLDAVEVQLNALLGRIEVANEYLAETQVLLPWGKDSLKIGVDEVQARYDVWAAMTEDDILDMYYNDETLSDTIMNNGVRFLNNNYITPFVNLNAPLTDMPVAIETAQQVLGQRIYGSSSKKADFAALIADAQKLYSEKLVAAYSEDNAQALVDMKAALEAMAVEFKVAIDATVLVDIDFGTQEAPVAFEEHTTEPDSVGETSTYYTIAGAKGVMTLTDITGSYPYALGWGSATDETTGAVIATDSLGMLRVGNSEAVVEFSGAPVGEFDIVNIKFDLYYGNLNKKNAGYKVLSAEGDTICGLFCSKYSGTAVINTFGVDFNSNISAVGSSTASNSAIAAESNRTQFDIVLDYGTKTMYCTTSGSKGTVTTEAIALPELVPGKFVIYSDYNNFDRRSWFDNLLIQNIAADDPAGVESVEVVRPVDNNMYNLQGQRILAPVKGQIYIQNGRKMIAK